MKILEGYILDARLQGGEHIFYGSNRSYPQVPYEDIRTNGLTFFDKPEQANRLLLMLGRSNKNISAVETYKIRLEISESVGEAEKLRGCRLVVIADKEAENPLASLYDIYGRPVPKRPHLGFLGSFFQNNGFIPLTGEEALETAKRLAEEILRRRQMRARIAEIYFKKIIN
jgi:hypothetical protein